MYSDSGVIKQLGEDWKICKMSLSYLCRLVENANEIENCKTVKCPAKTEKRFTFLTNCDMIIGKYRADYALLENFSEKILMKTAKPVETVGRKQPVVRISSQET